ncbi:hypothetical protein HAX54_009361, partial [Datura stramonium]|nr:hypothetical protein [Datura stramonium]
MEEYYVSFKEKRSIHAEAQFEVDSFKMPSQISMTRLNTTDVLIEVAILLACFMGHVHINVRELIADQFKRRAMQYATTLPFPSPVSMLCVNAAYLLFQQLDRNVQAKSLIILATKTNKDAPTMKRAMCTMRKTPPLPSASSTMSIAQFHPAPVPTPKPSNFLKIEQRAHKAMQLAKDKLKSICSTIEVVEREVISFRNEVVSLSEPPSTSNSNPPQPIVLPVQIEAPKSPPDDWW